MWRLTLSNAIAHRSRLALTWLAVALGVAFVTGSLVLTDTSTRLLDDQFRTDAAGVDLTVRTAAAFDAAMGVEVQRDPMPAGVTDRIVAAPGVEAARPVVAGPGQLETSGALHQSAGPTVVSTWAEAPFTAYHLWAGHAPHGNEVVLDVATARARGIDVNDTVTVAATGSRRLRVVGLAAFGKAEGLANTTSVLVDLHTAQHLLGVGSRVTSVDVVAADGIAVPALRDRLASALGKKYAVTSAQDASAARADAARQSIGFLRLVLLALAAAGLVVGALLIANTFGMVLTQRARELALVRAAGATGRQVLASVLGEALLIGVSGAVGGIVAGLGAAQGLRRLGQSTGLAMPGGPLEVTPRTVAVALGAGTLVTLLAALGPARRAARVAPVEAMRASEVTTGGVRRRRLVAGLVLLALGLVQLLAAALMRDIAGVALGILLTLAALVVLGPVLVPRLAHAVARPLHGLGVPGDLARESTVRSPRRTTGTVMALALGLALISFVAVLGASVKAISAESGEAITADLLVQSSRDEMLGGLSPRVAARVAALPQVSAVSRTRIGHWLDHGMTSVLSAVDPSTLPRVAEVRMAQGSLAALGRDGVVVAADVARERGLKVGDTLRMTFPRDGEQPMRVVGVMADSSARGLSTSYVLSLAGYARHYSENVDAAVYVALTDGVANRPARQALRSAVRGFPNAEVVDQAQAAAGRAAAVEQVFGLITALLGFAVLIALLGITNTLALSIVERTREIGLLRAVGMARRQVAGMVRAEAVLVAAVAVVLGVVLGTGLAAATLAGLSADMPLVVRVPVGQLLAVVGVAVLAGLVAGLLPARRAARLDVLEAITAE